MYALLSASISSGGIWMLRQPWASRGTTPESPVCMNDGGGMLFGRRRAQSWWFGLVDGTLRFNMRLVRYNYI